MQRFQLKKDSKNKWFIFDDQRKAVVTGHITTGMEGAETLKVIKTLPEPLPKIKEATTNNERVVAGRSKKMKISVEEYRRRFPRS